jgi:hypothetical protein
MTRCLAFLLALVFASVSVASACSAAVPADWIHFTLEPQRGSGEIEAVFSDERRGRYETHWSTGFPPSQLIGLDLSGFRAVGARPLRFAVVREAGRLDCSGHGGESYAAGNCAFTPDSGFARLLESRGIGRPSRDEAFGMMAVNVRREVIDAVAGARYPTPTIDQLMALTAVGVTGIYIRDLARLGYRPGSLDTLVEFRALDITPQYAGGFARLGYGTVDPNDLVQLKALNVTPDYVAAFQRMGYGHLPVDTLVQLKALDITPEFVRSLERRPGPVPVDEVVQAKILGRRN